MKAPLIAILLFFFLATNAQYNPDAPWMQSLSSAQAKPSNKKRIKFSDLVESFNIYWSDKDALKKGSGYKPFKRWETFWETFVKDDGSLPSANELWNVWEQKQAFSKTNALADVSDWQPLGPFEHTNTGSWSSGQGRINAITIDPQNLNIYYAGAPAGGIWKSNDYGSTWNPLSDNLPQIGVSGIAVDHNDSDIIYIATGDDDGSNTYSIGVMKSIDGGETWNSTGLDTTDGNPDSMNKIYMHPSNSHILWVATNKGVYKTIDGGLNWSNSNGTSGLEIKDLKLKPTDPDTIYAVTTNMLYISIDGGASFTNTGVGIGLPATSGRLVIDVTPDNPNAIYVLSSLPSNFTYEGKNLSHAFQGLYKSKDSGINFTTQAIYDYAGNGDPKDVGDIFESSQAWFDMALAVSDTDENEVYTGVLNIWKSTDSGENFTKVNQWFLPNSASYSHADIHFLKFFDGALLAGTDGGFYKTTDGGINFSDLSAGMQIGQFYRISVSKETSAKMIGGLQDNGGYAYNGLWQVYYGADGMEGAVNPDNSNQIYGFIQFGSNLYISNTSGASNDAYVNAPDNEVDEGNNDSGGNWITPLVINRDGELFAGYSSLYQLGGTQWTQISNSFGNNVNIDFLEIDEINPNNIYVALDKKLYKSMDKGVTINETHEFSSNLTSIEVNNNDSDILYVTTAGSSGGVFRSLDGGQTFNDITGTSLPNITKNIIKHQNLHVYNPLYLGTSLGVYRYDDAVGDWEPFERGLPNVAVRDLEINLNDGNITAATYGRGIWQSEIPSGNIQHEIGLQKITGAKSLITCGSVDTVKAIVKNWGTNNINSVLLSYTINGSTENTVWTGTILPNTTAIIDIPAFSIPTEGLNELTINASMGNDTFSGNNELSTYLFKNTSGIFNSENDFELISDELLSINENSSLSGYWDRGLATGTLLNTESTGNQVYGTNLSGSYANNTKSFLVSKCYDLSIISNPVFKFDMAFDLENNWDVLYVEYSTDSGLNWDVLGTANDVNWYNSDRTPGSDCHNCPGAQWTGTDTALRSYSYDLSAFNNETNMMFRFVFHSDQFTVKEGVILDNLVLEGTLNISEFDSNVFSIYPNPSEGTFNISSKAVDKIDYYITDISGKTILIKNNINLRGHPYQINLNGFGSGVYFINLSSKNRKATKKLFVK